MTTPSVLITGASTGIGEACAYDLDRRGVRVFAGVRRGQDAERLRANASDSLIPVIVDVTDSGSIDQAERTVAQTLNGTGLDGLVNNAGISVAGPLELLPLDDLRRQFEVNVFGQVAVTRAFLPALRAAKGRVVNMSSISGRVAAPLLGPYAMSKFALEAFSDSLRREVAGFDVHVACIEPGAIATPIWDKSLDDAERARNEMPAEGIALYGDLMTAMATTAKKLSKSAVSTERVTKAVHHALTAKRPKTRYLVGPDARVQAFFSAALPDRWVDALFRRMLA